RAIALRAQALERGAARSDAERAASGLLFGCAMKLSFPLALTFLTCAACGAGELDDRELADTSSALCAPAWGGACISDSVAWTYTPGDVNAQFNDYGKLSSDALNPSCAVKA